MRILPQFTLLGATRGARLVFLGTGGSLSLRGFPLDVVRDACQALEAAVFEDLGDKGSVRLADPALNMPATRTGHAFPVVDAPTGWKGHVIVCGLPSVGLRIVEHLALSGVSAVVVDDDPPPALVRTAAAWGVTVVTGPTRAAETLMSAGLAGAAAVICAQDDDLSALETALLARRLRADVRVVAQLTNPAVGRAVRQAGVAVLDVAGLSAPSVVEVCAGDGVQEMPLSGMRFLAARTTAPRTATLRELYGALAPVAVVPPAGDVLVCPGRDTLVSAGDEVTLIGTPGELAAAAVIDHPERIRSLAGPGAAPSVPGAAGVLGCWAATARSCRPPWPSGPCARCVTWPCRSPAPPTGGWHSPSAHCSRCWSPRRWCSASPTSWPARTTRSRCSTRCTSPSRP